ncbi:MAG: nickel-dependent lactate racemase [Candidatus Odinarchaeia archaeon]
MEIEIPFADKFQKVNLPDVNLHVVEMNKVPLRNEREVMESALHNPIGLYSFEDFLSRNSKFMLIINDATRSTPTPKMLDVIYPYLKNLDFEVMVATGSHRAPTDAEYRALLGDYYNRLKDKVMAHNCFDNSNLQYLGKTSRGTEIYVNKLVLNRALICLGSVEPHYFAGFTGGRKSIAPGVMGYKTIEHNHFLSLNRLAALANLKGNPVHEDLEEIVSIVQEHVNIFSINVVSDYNRRIYACETGDILDSFYPLVKAAEEVYCVKLKNKADIVLTIARPPQDINLYQAQKATESAKCAVKEGGIIILVASCWDGVGSKTFYDILASSKEPNEVYNKIKSNFSLGYHKAAKMVETMMMADVFAVTLIPDNAIKKIFIKPFKSVQEAVDKALKIKGEDAKIIVLKDGGMIAPIIES